MVFGRLEIDTPRGFDFWRTVHSHGWCSLPPFAVNEEEGTLSAVLELKDGVLVHCALKNRPGGLDVLTRSRLRLNVEQGKEIRSLLGECLRLGEDLSDFYRQAQRHPQYRWIPKTGAGRLLRAPTVFEDVVKMMCTTNCSWALTEVMIGNLTSALGKSLGDGLYSFPRPEAVAGTTEAFVRRSIRAGYRSPFLLELAANVADGRLDLEAWRSSPLSTEDLFNEVKSVKGIGDYAAGNILKLLGRYDYLGLDSWVRGQYYELHTRSRKVLDKTIEKRYASFGKWRGLFFWLEMTRSWYDHKFPF
jgi:N-glycosylase/DNA lyase